MTSNCENGAIVRVDDLFRIKAQKWLKKQYMMEAGGIVPRSLVILEFQEQFGRVDAAQIGKIVKQTYPGIGEVRRGPRGAAKRQYLGLVCNVSAKVPRAPKGQNHSPSGYSKIVVAKIKKNSRESKKLCLTNRIDPKTPKILPCEDPEFLKKSTEASSREITHQGVSVRVLRSQDRKVDKNERSIPDVPVTWLKIIDAGHKGRGVTVTRKVSKGSLVCDYGGKFISDPAKAKELLDATRSHSTEISYIFEFKHLDNILCWDATVDEGDYGRLINHSRLQANLLPRKVIRDGVPKICFFAKRVIEPNEELLYDYNSGNLPEVEWLSS